MLRDRTADLTVFFVKKLEVDGTASVDDSADAGTNAADKVCIFEDGTSAPAYRVQAHEVVHALEVLGDDSRPSALMDEVVGGEALSKSEIDTIDRSRR